jgi:outer membrane autotransporter protein
MKRGAYTESGDDALTYNSLRQESTSVLAGVKFTGKIDPQTFTVLSAGVEQDLNNNVGQYSAGSSNTAEFNSNVQKTRPVVSAGVYYDIDKTHRLGLNATHRQEAFQSTATTSALATYTVGF